MKDIYITWEDYHNKIEQLAKKVHEDNLKFNQIICIAKGGLRVGDVFSRLFNVPLAIPFAESYHGDSDDIKNQQGQFTFLEICKNNSKFRFTCFISWWFSWLWESLIKSIKWLEHFYGFYLDEKIKTAVIWHKSSSKFKPDYSADYLKTLHGYICLLKYETTNIKDFKFE